MDIICKPLFQDEVVLLDPPFSGRRMKAGERATFSDDEAKILLTNPNFVEASSGENPNFPAAPAAAPAQASTPKLPTPIPSIAPKPAPEPAAATEAPTSDK